MSLLSGRKILIVGGNGFVGNRVAAKLIQNDAKVSILSRHGPRFDYPENKKVNWIIGSAMEPEYIKDKINEADTIIHSLGTLFDTSITKFRKPGDAGTYEQMNRDTFIKLLQVVENPKKVIYISSVNPPPFLHRYLSTKMESQQFLFNTQHEGYAIRPGFIYDWDLKKWSIPLRFVIKGWNKIYPSLLSLPRNGTILQNFIKQFQQSEPTSLNKLAEAITYVSYKGLNKKIITDSDILQLSEKYEKLVPPKSGSIKQQNNSNKNSDH